MKWRRRFEEDMDAELRFHIDAYAAELMRSGLSPEEAQRRARLEFGSVEARKDECREAWGLRFIDELCADLRLTARLLRRSPGFALIAILSLGLGTGANTAIFGVLDSVMLRSLPVRDPNQLVFLHVAGTAGRDGPPYPLFQLIRDQAKSFESVAAFSPSAIELRTSQGRESVRGLWVSGNFHETLGVRPILGRTLHASDDPAAGQAPDGAVVVISDAFWRQRFGGDPAIVGRSVEVSGRGATIIGVIPMRMMSLEPGSAVDLAAPMALSDPAKMQDRTSLWLGVVARLNPRIRPEQALAETRSLFAGYMAETRVSDPIRQLLFQRAEMTPAGQGLRGLRRQFEKPLVVLTVLAGLLLLAACVNVSSLLLARATSRQTEFAVRLAIGASRARLVRQSLTEAFVLAALGMGLGCLVARTGQDALTMFLAQSGDPIVLDLSLNWRTFLYSGVLTALVTLAMGLLPALRVHGQSPDAALRGARGTAGRVSIRLGRGLVTLQVALSMVLLCGAGLFVATLRALSAADLGFTQEGLMTMEVTPERDWFGTERWLQAQAEILDRVGRIPQVRAAAWATMVPMTGRDRGAVLDVPGYRPTSETDKHIHLQAVSPEYFETAGVPLLWGRRFSARDNGSAPKAAILNDTAARFYFGRQSAIGRKIRFTNYAAADLEYEVVGIVKDSKHNNPREAAVRFVYLPITQSVDRVNRLTLLVRCDGDAAPLAGPVSEQVREARGGLLVAKVATMETLVSRTVAKERLMASLATAFGIAALVLACIGLYGIVAYSVSRRTREIGIRVALGASTGRVVGMIMNEAIVLCAIGVAAGLPAAYLLARLSRSLLYGVEGLSPLAAGVAAGLLLACGVLAAWAPSRRAISLEPLSALRRE